MNDTPLGALVTLGGLALQSEDCAIRAAVHARGERPGLARLENERHHQFIIWRALLPIWPVQLEADGHTDIVVDCNGELHHFELKNWRGATGRAQLPSIRNDIDRMRRRRNGYICITSMNPLGDTDNNIRFLLDQVGGLEVAGQRDFRFQTFGHDGRVFEFWIAGWPVIRD